MHCHQVFVCGYHRFPGKQCLLYPLLRGFKATGDFHHHLNIAGEHVLPIIGPFNRLRHPGYSLPFDVSIEHMSQAKVAACSVAQQFSDRFADCSESKNRNLGDRFKRFAPGYSGRTLPRSFILLIDRTYTHASPAWQSDLELGTGNGCLRPGKNTWCSRCTDSSARDSSTRKLIVRSEALWKTMPASRSDTAANTWPAISGWRRMFSPTREIRAL